MKILAINPGSTSTKIAVYEDSNKIFSETLRHSSEEISAFKKIIDQYEFRMKIILNCLEKANISSNELDAVVGRGGLLKPIPSGVYRVNDAMIEDLKHDELRGEHASNLGAVLAKAIANSIPKKIDAFIVDPVVVDELQDLARYTGHPELPKVCIFHALNQKAVARRYARENNAKYEDLSLIVVHLGGGVSIGAHYKGKVIDVNNALNGDGPFSPERSGTLPVLALARLCYSGKYKLDEVSKMIVGKGGMVAYLGTNDANKVEHDALAGDAKSKEVYEAMAYQIAKEIGAESAVLYGKVDAIILTGGIAYSDMIVNWIKERVGFIAKIVVYPGEDEMQALSEAAYYALKGEMDIKEYV